MVNRITKLLVLIVFLSCHEKERYRYSVCNDLLSACSTSKDSDYCTFGYKFGDGNPFTPDGFNTPGPGVKGKELSFRFQSAGFTFNTHSQSNRISFDFSEVEKTSIRKYISQWTVVADFTLIEKDSDQTTDITIILAEIEQGGIGYPKLVGDPCNALAGFLILNTKSQQRARLSLHEMGHVLGLGHVLSDNVMNPNKSFDSLQNGDILGIQSIYGAK